MEPENQFVEENSQTQGARNDPGPDPTVPKVRTRLVKLMRRQKTPAPVWEDLGIPKVYQDGCYHLFKGPGIFTP